MDFPLERQEFAVVADATRECSSQHHRFCPVRFPASHWRHTQSLDLHQHLLPDQGQYVWQSSTGAPLVASNGCNHQGEARHFEEPGPEIPQHKRSLRGRSDDWRKTCYGPRDTDQDQNGVDRHPRV
jgi:hypothetical protein